MMFLSSHVMLTAISNSLTSHSFTYSPRVDFECNVRLLINNVSIMVAG